MIRREVQLVQVTKEQAKSASLVTNAIFERYGLSSADRDVLWKAAQIMLTYALLEEGQIPGSSDGSA